MGLVCAFSNGRRAQSKRLFKEVDKIYEKLLSAQSHNNGGKLSFLPAYRSLGIGKELYSRFLNYMKNESIEHCYVYTDTTCNYGFYERQNMLQCGTEKITLQLNASPKNFLFFIYDN